MDCSLFGVQAPTDSAGGKRVHDSEALATQERRVLQFLINNF
ncbi:hypothetical protein [Nostoc sp. LEGE 12447]|nr:hypothetical protein [Nostoc sp. LEGE 12447]